MQLAQKLYEGVELSNEKAVGLITYMRTDGLHVGTTELSNILLPECLFLWHFIIVAAAAISLFNNVMLRLIGLQEC